MPALPGTPRTWVAGEYPTAAMFNAEIKDSLNFLENPPACRVYHSSAQSISSGALATLAFNSERYKTAGYASMHDNATNNSRITIATPGLYEVGASVAFAVGADYTLQGAWIRLNGGGTFIATHVQGTLARADYYGAVTLSTVYKLGIGDYVELQVSQINTAAAARNVQAAAAYSPEFFAVRVGKG